jgi:hypothetical protein
MTGRAGKFVVCRCQTSGSPGYGLGTRGLWQRGTGC